ncbi:MAG TPA: CvpA family protein [Acetobacteraceae bacterium]|nr:CvpA family protein [Acetobacteraceae bacterium]
MNFVDVMVLALVGVSALLGFSRGLVREALGIGAWVGAAWGAIELYPVAQPYARRMIGNPDIADPAAYVAGFVALLIVLSLVANLAGRLIRVSVLGGLDRTLGILFGLARGAALVIAAYIVGGLVLPPENWPEAVQHAQALPIVYEGAGWATSILPATYRPRVAEPPAARETAAEDLLQANPSGRATGARPTDFGSHFKDENAVRPGETSQNGILH